MDLFGTNLRLPRFQFKQFYILSTNVSLVTSTTLKEFWKVKTAHKVQNGTKFTLLTCCNDSEASTQSLKVATRYPIVAKE